MITKTVQTSATAQVGVCSSDLSYDDPAAIQLQPQTTPVTTTVRLICLFWFVRTRMRMDYTRLTVDKYMGEKSKVKQINNVAQSVLMN